MARRVKPRSRGTHQGAVSTTAVLTSAGTAYASIDAGFPMIRQSLITGCSLPLGGLTVTLNELPSCELVRVRDH